MHHLLTGKPPSQIRKSGPYSATQRSAAPSWPSVWISSRLPISQRGRGPVLGWARGSRLVMLAGILLCWQARAACLIHEHRCCPKEATHARKAAC